MTEYLTPGVRDQIEAYLGHELQPDELVTVTSLDGLNDAQTAVVETLAIAGRFPPSVPTALRMEPVYERELERPLSDDERRSAASLQSLSPAQLAVARQLSLKDPAFAMAYLSEVCQSASAYDRQLFAEGLRSRTQ